MDLIEIYSPITGELHTMEKGKVYDGGIAYEEIEKSYCQEFDEDGGPSPEGDGQ